VLQALKEQRVQRAQQVVTVVTEQQVLLVLRVRREQMGLLGVQELLTLRVALMVTSTLKLIPIRYGRRQEEIGLK
jgi:hypothetical protein